MVLLSRTVRFSVPLVPPPAGAAASGANGYAGVPPMTGLGAHYEMTVWCRGEADPVTGYICDIRQIDRAVREAVVPRVAACVRERPGTAPAEALRSLMKPLASAMTSELARVRWNLSPYYSLEMSVSDPNIVLLRQRFEFAASHRLHAPAMSDAENRALFGKCNNPSGHGHNYVVEPCVAMPVASAAHGGVEPLSLGELEKLVDEIIIQRFDHKHLNSEAPEFGGCPGGAAGATAAKAGLIPTVENIAKVCYQLLAPAVERAGAKGGGATLRSVTVWETEKTAAMYPG